MRPISTFENDRTEHPGICWASTTSVGRSQPDCTRQCAWRLGAFYVPALRGSTSLAAPLIKSIAAEAFGGKAVKSYGKDTIRVGAVSEVGEKERRDRPSAKPSREGTVAWLANPRPITYSEPDNVHASHCLFADSYWFSRGLGPLLSFEVVPTGPSWGRRRRRRIDGV